jgi:hypothetical protein
MCSIPFSFNFFVTYLTTKSPVEFIPTSALLMCISSPRLKYAHTKIEFFLSLSKCLSSPVPVVVDLLLCFRFVLDLFA